MSLLFAYDTTHKHAVDTVGNGPNQTTYSYDANGNMSTRNGLTVGWSSYNLPITINGASGVYANFSYGADRQRKQQTAKYVADGQSGIETTIYVFGLYEYETTPAQTHNKYFIQVPGGTQIIYDIQSVNGVQTTYITGDHLGSGNIFLSSSGSKQINESYSAYGYRRSSSWSGPLSSGSSDYTTIASTTRRGYTDAFHEVLDNLNLIHMNGRVYDPVIGRFMSPDPIVTQVGNSQSINPYSYVQNRPLTMTDPTGLAPGTPIDPGGRGGHGCKGKSYTCEDAANPGGTGPNTGGYDVLVGGSVGGGGEGSVSGTEVSFTSDALDTAPNPQNSADSALAGTAGSSSDPAVTGGSDLGNALRNNIPLVGGLLGAAGDILSGAANIGLGIATFGQSGTLETGFSELGGGVASALQIGFTDLAAALIGVGAYIYNNVSNAIDVLTLGNAHSDSFLKSIKNLALTAAIPDYGLHGGPQWGKLGDPALNYIDKISAEHDIVYGNEIASGNNAHATVNWVGAAWSSSPNGQVAPGPAGIAYALLGTIPFLLYGEATGK